MVDGTYMGPQNSFTFYEVDHDQGIVAIFKNEYALTIIIVGLGRVNTDPNKISYSYGDVVQLTAISNNKEYRFAYWSGDLTGDANPHNNHHGWQQKCHCDFYQRTHALTK